MTFSTVQKTKTLRSASLMAAGFAIAAVLAPSAIHHVMGSEYAQPPYSNYFGFPVPWGGCDNGQTWCDIFDPVSGIMNLSDFPFSGQYDESFVDWNVNPLFGNSPTTYYPMYYPVYWGSTWDAVGSMVETSWPFYGQMEVGGALLECSESTTNCTSNQYNFIKLLGIYLTSDEVNGNVGYQYQSSYQWVYQDPDRLYTSIPVGYTSAYANNCENSCYGGGYTDFGEGGNYLLVRNLYAFPEE